MAGAALILGRAVRAGDRAGIPVDRCDSALATRESDRPASHLPEPGDRAGMLVCDGFGSDRVCRRGRGHDAGTLAADSRTDARPDGGKIFVLAAWKLRALSCALADRRPDVASGHPNLRFAACVARRLTRNHILFAGSAYADRVRRGRWLVLPDFE